MSQVTACRSCGGNIVEPAYPGDGAYPVPPMCTCASSSATEDTRCAMCGRRVATSGPYATCRRCSDDLNSGGGEWRGAR